MKFQEIYKNGYGWIEKKEIKEIKGYCTRKRKINDFNFIIGDN